MNEQIIKDGLRGEKSTAVTMDSTALAMGSGDLRVFATPAMAALAEGCCAESVEDLIDEADTTVGSRLVIDHLSPSPVGAGIVCKSRLTAVDGRRLDFEFEVFDSSGLIGRGEHTRYIVNADKLLKKASDKLRRPL